MRKILAAGVLIVAVGILVAGRAAPAAETVLRHRVENLASYVFHFGGGVGRRQVTPDMMTDFVEEEIVPRFPTGTTVQRGEGQWQNPDTGKILREDSYVLAVECDPTPENKDKVEAIAGEYVRRYRDAHVSCFVKIFPSVTTELFYPGE